MTGQARKLTLFGESPDLFFAAPFPPPWAGPEAVTQNIIDTDYLQTHFRTQFISTTLRRSNVEKGRLHIRVFVKLALLWFKSFCCLLTRRPQIAYTTLSQNRSGFLRDASFVWLFRLFGIPTVLHFHGGNFKQFYEKQTRCFQSFIRATLAKTAGVIVLGKKLKYEFKDLVDNKPLHVLYNGVPLPSKTIRPKTDATVSILYMGSISVSKGTHLLLEAARFILQRHSKVEFNIVGEIIPSERNIFFGPDGQPLVSYNFTRAAMPDYIHLQPPVSGQKKESLFLRSDIFVLPSYAEGFPMSVLEAMSYGLALLVTSVGALPEILKEDINCLFVPPGSAEALTEALDRLIQDSPLRQAMGNANRKLVETEFTSATMVKNLGDIFNWTIGQNTKDI